MCNEIQYIHELKFSFILLDSSWEDKFYNTYYFLRRKFCISAFLRIRRSVYGQTAEFSACV